MACENSAAATAAAIVSLLSQLRRIERERKIENIWQRAVLAEPQCINLFRQQIPSVGCDMCNQMEQPIAINVIGAMR